MNEAHGSTSSPRMMDDEKMFHNNSNINNNEEYRSFIPSSKSKNTGMRNHHHGNKMASSVIRQIQSIRLPRVMSSYLPTPNLMVKRDDEAMEYASNDGRISLVTGLDQVFLDGTMPASQAVKICGMRPPQYLWYMLSGSFCDLIQLFIDLLIHITFGIENASVCWILGFSLSILVRHSSHRYLVFGMYVGGYRNSLMRMYGGYSISIILSTIANYIMTEWYAVPHYVAWVFTLLWTGVVNYFILKKLWSFGGSTTGPINNNNNNNNHNSNNSHNKTMNASERLNIV